jgi:hypothetical protein
VLLCAVFVLQDVGGGGGIEGMSGSVGNSSTGQIFEAMKQLTGMGPHSHFTDIGGGVGRCACATCRLLLSCGALTVSASVRASAHAHHYSTT